MNITRDQAEKFARTAVAAYQRMNDGLQNTRTVAYKTAAAEFEGICKAADALNLAHTPTDMYMKVYDSRGQVADELGARPAFVFTSQNSKMHAWDDRLVALIADKLVD